LNFGIGECGLQLGEGVNIQGFIVASPKATPSLRGIIAEDDLQPRAEWQLFGNFAIAPTGYFGDLVNITRQPAGATQFPDPEPFPPMISLALAE
jgi:hypothetical protein